jgi:aspartyl-tRNA(Asn)/glutamyl-tRNA(Gln) amidotransferase subunit B
MCIVLAGGHRNLPEIQLKMEYEAVIGLEVHVQVDTRSKMFTRTPHGYGEPPNTLTDPVVMGLPGALPVMNLEAIDKSIKVGLLLGCEIAKVCKWDRKHYFYPDMPKNYQISQFDQPICLGGEVEIEMEGENRAVMGLHRKVQLTRIHLEEDVGKLTHCENDSLVDYNRAGSALLEIVSEPDLFSPDEVFAYLHSLRNSLLYAGISDCDMEKGQMRCDANVSVRPVGQSELGTKVELKNLNTISGVRNGVEYEIKRQSSVLRDGGTISQETRRWNPEQRYTTAMRSKEMAHDYRYFPDPDLMPVKIDDEWIDRIREEIPEMPFDKQRRFMEEYNLPYSSTSPLCPEKELCDFFEETVRQSNQPKKAANWIVNDFLRELSAAGNENGPLPLAKSKITPSHLAELVSLIEDGSISSNIAKEIFPEIFATGKKPAEIVEEKDLKQTSDTGELEAICSQVMVDHPKAVEEFKSGKENAINALKGQVMKATRGQANPKLVDDILRKLLSS